MNPLCQAKLKRSIEIFVSRQAMNIEGLGEKLVELLVDSELVKNVSDIYKLVELQMIPLPRMGQKSAKNLIEQIKISKTRELHTLIIGLGIPQVGAKIAKDLAKYFGSMDKLKNATNEEIIVIDGIGDEIAKNIQKFFALEYTEIIINNLKQSGVNMEETDTKTGNYLQGLKFVLTGTLKNYSRNDFKNIIETNGGKVSGSVSKKTNYVVIGTNPGSKYTKAQSLGVEIIDEDAFMQLLSELSPLKT